MLIFLDGRPAVCYYVDGMKTLLLLLTLLALPVSAAVILPFDLEPPPSADSWAFDFDSVQPESVPVMSEMLIVLDDFRGDEFSVIRTAASWNFMAIRWVNPKTIDATSCIDITSARYRRARDAL